MSTETLPPMTLPGERHSEPTYTIHKPDYSNPDSPDLDRLLDQANGNVIVAARILLDGMISGEIQ